MEKCIGENVKIKDLLIYVGGMEFPSRVITSYKEMNYAICFQF